MGRIVEKGSSFPDDAPQAPASTVDSVDLTAIRELVPEVLIPDREIMGMPEARRNRAFINLFKGYFRARADGVNNPDRAQQADIVKVKLESLRPGFQMDYDIHPWERVIERDVRDYATLMKDGISSSTPERRQQIYAFEGYLTEDGRNSLHDEARRINSGIPARLPRSRIDDWSLDRLDRAGFEAIAESEIAAEDSQVQMKKGKARSTQAEPTDVFKRQTMTS